MKNPAYQSFTEVKQVVIKDFDEDHIRDLVDLQDEIIHEMENIDHYRHTSIEEYIELLRMGSKVIGLYFDQELIAYAALLKPNCFNQKLMDAPMFHGVDRNHVYYYKCVAVKKGYRGRGVHLFVNDYFESYVLHDGGTHIVLVVHPDNEHSVKNFEKSGYVPYLDYLLDGKHERKAFFKTMHRSGCN